MNNSMVPKLEEYLKVLWIQADMPTVNERGIQNHMSGRNSITCSIIIPVIGKPELTVSCLERLIPAINTTDAEIIIFDNGSTKADRRKLESAEGFATCRYIRNKKNIGFAAACNAATTESRGDILCFLNNDVTVNPGWLEALMKPLGKNPRTVVGALLKYPDGTVQHAGIGIGIWGLPVNLGIGSRPEEWSSKGEYYRCTAATGACFLVKKNVFLSLGGFDEQYFFSYEDVDFCLRAQRNDILTVICSSVDMIHHEGASSAPLRMNAVRAQAEELFVQRWGKHLEAFQDQYLENIAGSDLRNLAIWGTGRAGRHLADRLLHDRRFDVLAFISSSIGSCAAECMGKPVYTPDQVPSDIDGIFVASMFHEQIRKTAGSWGLADRLITGITEYVDFSTFD
jgi:GT2 family glycosyltransferase